tara:strand:+ start:677 stop:1135 length:459 start_codon:yes stop_codon:yes gene_type:complete
MDEIDNILQSYFGEGASLDTLSTYQPTDWMQAISDKFDIDIENLDESMFPGISESLIKSAKFATYAPGMEAGTQSALTSLLNPLKGKKSEQAHGGFAGSYGAKQFTDKITDAYGRDVTPIISSARDKQLKAGSSIADQIQSYITTGMDIKYG